MWLREGRAVIQDGAMSISAAPLRILLESEGEGHGISVVLAAVGAAPRGVSFPPPAVLAAAVSAFGRGIRKEALYFRLGDGEGEGGNADLFLLYHEKKRE